MTDDPRGEFRMRTVELVVEALDDHDIDAALGAFAHDARLVRVERESGRVVGVEPVAVGIDEVRGWFQQLIDRDLSIRLRSRSDVGGIVTVQTTWALRSFRDEYVASTTTGRYFFAGDVISLVLLSAP